MEFSSPSPVARKRILIVEDDPTMQPILERMIHKINPRVSIDWTTSAEEALEVIRAVGAYELFFSDIMLAGAKSGEDLFEDCRALKLAANFVLTSGRPATGKRVPFLRKPLRFREVEACFAPILAEIAFDARLAPAGGLLERRPDRAEIEAYWDRQFEWFMFVMSAICVAWLFYQVAREMGHLPFRPFPLGATPQLIAHDTPR